MGTDCAPFLANLFLFYYEFKWLDKQRIENPHRLKFFKSCCRYIDDLFLVNNNDLMKKYMLEIYPKELNLIPDETDGQSLPFLDLLINIKEGVISTSIFDKRDAFNFPIVNFPILSGNIPNRSSYGVFIGEAVRYARACTHYDDFLSRIHILVKKLKTQLFKDSLLKKSWKRFCNSHLLLILKFPSRVLTLYKTWT